ncbi:hypothetical protein ACRALDRAFT_2040230 [Sodiomyces alcalophilus JCM 7366]|uniref:uncharacterized protein n=1 Tax=Sodiomyces alcalophilus JCM 7366 TaxID=591952 RepID=UPI0039B406C4
MKIGAVLLFAWSALTAAQVTYNNNTGEYVCDRPNANYCGGNSLETDIIIRCNNASQGQPGRCAESLVGYQPPGGSPAVCYQTSPSGGDAACAQNCTVFPEDGRNQFTLPPDQCTPGGGAGGNQTTAAPAPTGIGGGGGGGGPGQTGNATGNATATQTGVPTATGVVPTAGAAHNGVGALAIAGFAAVFFL